MQNKNLFTNPMAIAAIVVAILLCCCCIIIVLGGAAIFSINRQVGAVSTVLPPVFDYGPATPTPLVELTRTPVEAIDGDSLEVLKKIDVPENDPYDLACRLKNICDVARTVPGKEYKLGDHETFWVSNSDTDENRQVQATLLYSTPHSYFWAEDGVRVNKGALKKLMDTFEEKIYPTDRAFFGSEWTPGVDGDPHIFVLFVNDIGSTVAGYFSSIDSFNPAVKPYSNGHETYVFGTSESLNNEYTYATLAHEFVHMIQFASDRNEANWFDEGFAEVGALLNGYTIGMADWAYVMNPDLQLTDWVDSASPDFGRHYGQSFLYLTYFLDRFGQEATQALTKNPENDLASVDDTLAQLKITDPLTGHIITAEDVFMDWAAALYLMDGAIGDGRYTYHNYPNAPQPQAADVITACPQSAFNRTVNQYGLDYISIQCRGAHTIQFTGSTQVSLLPFSAHSGDYAFWSNRGNESDMTLTRAFDFSNVAGPIAISYWTWYDIEKDWDYLYLEASTDNGRTWTILKTPAGTSSNPSGQNYGWAYTGQTSDWQKETVDLSQYAGRTVQLRFEYITDAAVNGAGLLLDDVAVDAINYRADFESTDGGWQAAGFARIQNVLPQTFRLMLITKGATTKVETIPLNADQTADISIALQPGEEAVLIVAGTTRFTYIETSYSISIK